MALGLCTTAGWAVWRYTAHDNNDWNLNHNSLTPAYNYFDTNRNAPGILAIRQLTGDHAALTTHACTKILGYPMVTSAAGDGVGVTTGWRKVTNLLSWRGSNAGCLVNGVAVPGACSPLQLNSGKNIAANPSINLNRWRNNGLTNLNMFCVLEATSRTYQEVGQTQCGAGTNTNVVDCGNHCYTMPTGWTGNNNKGCPLGPWKFGSVTGAATTFAGWKSFPDKWEVDEKMAIYYQRLTATVNTVSDSVDISASWYGGECTNPQTFAKDPNGQYPLMLTTGTGCDTLGLNNMSEKADSINEWDFLEDNRDLMVNANTPT
jgi:hypothetical protein